MCIFLLLLQQTCMIYVNEIIQGHTTKTFWTLALQRLRNHVHGPLLFHLKTIHPKLSRSQFQKHLWATPATCWNSHAARKMPQYHQLNDLSEIINNLFLCFWLHFLYLLCKLLHLFKNKFSVNKEYTNACVKNYQFIFLYSIQVFIVYE